MKKLAITLLSVALVPMLVVSCGGQKAPAGAALPDTPEAAAFNYRDGLMRAVQWKVGKLRGMAQGEVTVDEAFFKKTAHDVATRCSERTGWPTRATCAQHAAFPATRLELTTACAARCCGSAPGCRGPAR